MIIRPETPEDHAAIRHLTTQAFAPMPFSEGNEAECIDKLRRDGDLTLSLVTQCNEKIIAHVAFSPVFLDGISDGWFGLGPVSVKPGFQRMGTGSALIRQGLDILQQTHATGCILIGDPDYYCRFGFVGDGRISYRSLPDKVVQWLSFNISRPRGW